MENITPSEYPLCLIFKGHIDHGTNHLRRQTQRRARRGF